MGHINCTMLLQSAVANLSMSLAHHVWIFCFHPCCPALAIPSPRFVVMKHNQYIHAGCTYPMLVMCLCHVFMVIVIRREAQEKNMLLLAGFSWVFMQAQLMNSNEIIVLQLYRRTSIMPIDPWIHFVSSTRICSELFPCWVLQQYMSPVRWTPFE